MFILIHGEAGKMTRFTEPALYPHGTPENSSMDTDVNSRVQVLNIVLKQASVDVDESSGQQVPE
jgi:hypothetical protein